MFFFTGHDLLTKFARFTDIPGLRDVLKLTYVTMPGDVPGSGGKKLQMGETSLFVIFIYLETDISGSEFFTFTSLRAAYCSNLHL